jgi:hypothetical protein
MKAAVGAREAGIDGFATRSLVRLFRLDREIGRPQRLDQANRKTAQHRARQRADAAEHRGGECLDARDKAHVEIDQAVIEQIHQAGDGGERGADHEGP